MSQRILIDGVEVGAPVDTDVVERPAIVDSTGKVTIATPEMEKLPSDQLRLLAKLAGGQVVWRKYEVTYREVKRTGSKKHAFCDWRDCWALADVDSDYCLTHDQLANGMK